LRFWRIDRQCALRVVLRMCIAGILVGALAGCTTPDGAVADSPDAVNTIRSADLRARFPIFMDSQSSGASQPARPMLFPGLGAGPTIAGSRNAGAQVEIASAASAVTAAAGGVEFNFDDADIKTVAKTLLGDTLQLNYIVDPRVQGSVTLSSTGPVDRKDVLPLFENVLRMSNAAVLHDGDLLKIVPVPEASGAGAVSIGAGQPGFGVSVVPLHYTSATTVAKMAENFLSRPGAIRADQARNVLLIQGTAAERQSAIDVVATFDVEWLRNQSVGIYPLKSTQPETMIQELDRIMEANEGGQGHGVIKFQPISRMNAVMVVAQNANLLAQATQWVRRLDRIDTSGNALRTYRLRYGSAQQVAKILNDIFVGGNGAGDTPANQIAPKTAATQSRLDSIGSGSGAGNGSASPASGGVDQSVAANGGGNSGGNSIGASFEGFAGRNGTANGNDTSALTSGSIGHGLFQNVRITADTANNSILIYSNEQDFHAIEHAVHDVDTPQLQVAIQATVAEVTLTDDLQYGVQSFLTSSTLGLGSNKGSVGLLPAAATTTSTDPTATAAGAVQSAFLQRVLPGFNLLLGSEAQPKAILTALSTITSVKVLSSPSLVALDNQPALLEVGDQVPVSTSSATLLTSSSTPVVNTINMVNTGVILKVLPHIHANGTVQLEIEQEISNVVNPDQQTLTPTISQRRIHSTVAVNSGQTVLLGGLISEEQDQTKTGIPGLNQIKYLGDLLGATSKNKTRSEIIVFIRPQVVRDGLDAQAVTEEFRQQLETMRSQGAVIQGKDVSPPATGVIHSKY
jgi:general secretion pathway protein D